MNSAQTNRRNKVIVIGVMGSIGRLIANKIAAAQNEVIGIDISEQVTDLAFKNIALRVENILQPTGATISDLASANTVVFAVSHQVIAAALPIVLQHIKSDCLLVDTLSIKTPFLQLLEHYAISQQAVGINPMFSGDLNPHNRPIAIVTYRGGKAAENFLTLVQSWDLRVVPMEAHQHDQVMAALQSLGHAVLIAFGKSLVEARIDPLLIDALAPPPFRLLLTLLARLTQNHPDVYWDIQANNPYAKKYRTSLQKSLGDLENTLATDNRHAFNADLGSFSEDLINEIPEFLQLSRKIFEFIHQHSNSANQYVKETV